MMKLVVFSSDDAVNFSSLPIFPSLSFSAHSFTCLLYASSLLVIFRNERGGDPPEYISTDIV
ncbi:hypothetical protein DPMN_121823 [Dreissena polymorpha]|uniref:Uncharacterized protein n=1 Tax=Dreissena polymorpha TaxID=45954 RepID=A0A9D4GR87_DREPO|nr:hypothetical protein DPMN_121823 [Dreissena polymorpha]